MRRSGHTLLRRKVYLPVAGASIIALVIIAVVLHLSGTSDADAGHTPAAAPTPGCGTTSETAMGSTLLGVTASTTGQLNKATAEFGSLPIIRVYDTGMPDPQTWKSGTPALNHSAVVLSFRSPPTKVLSGADDAALTNFFDRAPAVHPIYYSYYHEPEPLIESGAFTLTQYKAAWAHISAIAARAHNACLVPTLILMSWDLNPAAGINWRNYLPAGHVIKNLSWDAYPAGTVHDSHPQPTPPAQFMGPAEAASKSVGLPFGFAEFALGTPAGRPQWLTQVAGYLRQTGAAFGTLFNSQYYPWMQLRDPASISAWRAAIAGPRRGSAS
jgi:hypothetical protein